MGYPAAYRSNAFRHAPATRPEKPTREPFRPYRVQPPFPAFRSPLGGLLESSAVWGGITLFAIADYFLFKHVLSELKAGALLPRRNAQGWTAGTSCAGGGGHWLTGNTGGCGLTFTSDVTWRTPVPSSALSCQWVTYVSHNDALSQTRYTLVQNYTRASSSVGLLPGNPRSVYLPWVSPSSLPWPAVQPDPWELPSPRPLIAPRPQVTPWFDPWREVGPAPDVQPFPLPLPRPGPGPRPKPTPNPQPDYRATPGVSPALRPASAAPPMGEQPPPPRDRRPRNRERERKLGEGAAVGILLGLQRVGAINSAIDAVYRGLPGKYRRGGPIPPWLKLGRLYEHLGEVHWDRVGQNLATRKMAMKLMGALYGGAMAFDPSAYIGRGFSQYYGATHGAVPHEQHSRPTRGRPRSARAANRWDRIGSRGFYRSKGR